MKVLNIKKRIIGATGLLLIAGSAASITAGSYLANPAVAVAAPAANYISYDKAKSIALSHARVNATQIQNYKIELDQERYGTLYEVEFDYNGYDYDYKINATTGTIVTVQKELEDPVRARYTGVAEGRDDRWAYYINGVIDRSFTGVAKSSKGHWVFVRNGYYDRTFTGVAKSTKGNWIFVRNGRFDSTFTGVAKSTKGNWIYVKQGRYYTGFTGVARSTKGNRLYIVKGRWQKTYTGRFQNYNIKNGYVL